MLVDGVGDPVDSGISSDGLVVGAKCQHEHEHEHMSEASVRVKSFSSPKGRKVDEMVRDEGDLGMWTHSTRMTS